MRFKGKMFSASILMLCLCCLSSCDIKTNLLTIPFDVSYEPSAIDTENYKPTINLFNDKVELINYFSASPYEVGDKFYTDIDAFESEFGFDNYLIVYFEQMLNVTTTVNAYMDGTDNEDVVIIFNYNVSKHDTYLPADSFCQCFYLIDVRNFDNQIITITFKIGDKVFCTEKF